MKKKTASLEAKRRKYGYFFTAPFILGAVVAIIYPILISVIYSVSEVKATASGYDLNFVGIDNYKWIFGVDPYFKRALISTLKSTLLDVPVVIVISFFLASVLNGEFKGRAAARTILFLPLIMNSNIVMQILGADAVEDNLASKSSAQVGAFSGVFSEFLEQLNIGEGVSNLLISSVDNISNILAMSVIPIIIMLAGLQSVPKSVYEASFVEGATAWEVFWKISLPIVSPMILVSAIYCIIDSFTGVSNSVISRVKEECFTNLNFGIGSSMAWAYLSIVLVIVGAVFLIVNRYVSYSD